MKVCPFCGTIDHDKYEWVYPMFKDNSMYIAGNYNCGAPCIGREEAMAAWDTRASSCILCLGELPKYPGMYTCFTVGRSNYTEIETVYFEGNTWEYEGVTRWQPLPEVPDEA